MSRMKEQKFLKTSQQGELDAVPMYRKLAEKFDKNNPTVAEMLREMAADEGRHAGIFRDLSGQVLRPGKLLSVAVPLLMGLIGKKRMFAIIAKREYAAFDTYAPWTEKYPEILSVQADENKHGDMAKRIITLL